MIELSCIPTTCTFVLRLRREWSAGGPVWRGWIEHLPSGERAAVQNWEGVEAFVRKLGVEEDRVQVVDGGDGGSLRIIKRWREV